MNEKNTHVPRFVQADAWDFSQMKAGMSIPLDDDGKPVFPHKTQNVLAIKNPRELESLLLTEAQETIEYGHIGIAAFIIDSSYFNHSLGWMKEHPRGIYAPPEVKEQYKKEHPSWAHLRDLFLKPRNPAFYFMDAPVYIANEFRIDYSTGNRDVMAIPIINENPRSFPPGEVEIIVSTKSLNDDLEPTKPDPELRRIMTEKTVKKS